jgi:hypothetical protein
VAKIVVSLFENHADSVEFLWMNHVFAMRKIIFNLVPASLYLRLHSCWPRREKQ